MFSAVDLHCYIYMCKRQKAEILNTQPSNKKKRNIASFHFCISGLIVEFVLILRPGFQIITSQNPNTDGLLLWPPCHFGSEPNHRSDVQSLTFSCHLVKTHRLTEGGGGKWKNEAWNFSGATLALLLKWTRSRALWINLHSGWVTMAKELGWTLWPILTNFELMVELI